MALLKRKSRYSAQAFEPIGRYKEQADSRISFRRWKVRQERSTEPHKEEFSILLGGLGEEDSAKVCKAFVTWFTGGPFSRTHADAVSMMIHDLQPKLFSDRLFVRTGAHSYELALIPEDAHGEIASIKATVNNSLWSGMPVEFAYVSARGAHMRRINVKSIDANGFVGTHSRGTRRFNFDKVEWAITSFVEPHEVQAKPIVTISFLQQLGKNHVKISRGELYHEGAMVRRDFD